MAKKFLLYLLFLVLPQYTALPAFPLELEIITPEKREEKRKEEKEALEERFGWWPSDATPAPVKDEERGGYWWWPEKPGKVRPWGNRGYVYVAKIIFDYKEEELPPPKKDELRPSLLIKKLIKNVKIYFDFDKAGLRDDVVLVLENAVKTLKKNPESSILITGNCDIRGSEAYNMKLGSRRAQAVRDFMLGEGVSDARIRIVSRGKLDAVSAVTDLVGMQKDRNAQFMIAEVEEVMIPYNGSPEITDAKEFEEGKFIIEKEEEIESAVKVSTKEYIVKKGDSLSGIAKKEYGKANRWRHLWGLNKNRIKNPNKLKPGMRILIPIE